LDSEPESAAAAAADAADALLHLVRFNRLFKSETVCNIVWILSFT
jgi:hypothetical protein